MTSESIVDAKIDPRSSSSTRSSPALVEVAVVRERDVAAARRARAPAARSRSSRSRRCCSACGRWPSSRGARRARVVEAIRRRAPCCARCARRRRRRPRRSPPTPGRDAAANTARAASARPRRACPNTEDAAHMNQTCESEASASVLRATRSRDMMRRDGFVVRVGQRRDGDGERRAADGDRERHARRRRPRRSRRAGTPCRAAIAQHRVGIGRGRRSRVPAPHRTAARGAAARATPMRSTVRARRLRRGPSCTHSASATASPPSAAVVRRAHRAVADRLEQRRR